ncbi:hypothetical protein BBP40_003069 [Aspergillus hancockii]|nr:hypothetical protein BBP40_003069 [Aspergillus hancockii]
MHSPSSARGDSILELPSFIIGASFAGAPIAHSLLKDVASVKVTLINPSPTFYFVIAAPRFLAKPNAFKSDQYLIPIEKEFRHYPKQSFKFVQGRATAVDAQSKAVLVDNVKPISFDYLVIAAGSTTASIVVTNGIPIPFNQLSLDNMASMVRNAQDYIAGAKSIVIGGAGPIGVELAGEVTEAIRQSKRKAEVTLVSAADRVLPMLKPAGSTAAERLLTGRGVNLLKLRC